MKQETVSNQYLKVFEEYRKQLDSKNEKRERIIRGSRDVTQAAKKLILELHSILNIHRGNRGSMEKTVAKAKGSASKVKTMIAKRVAAELDNEQYSVFHPSFSPCLQEYIEATLFLGYLEHHRLLSPTELEAELSEACKCNGVKFSIPLTPDDYLLGVADLTGELMRLTINSAADGDDETPFETLAFMQKLCALVNNFHPVPRPIRRFWPHKMKVMKQSRIKVERTCYSLSVRAAEAIGKHRKER